MPLLSVRPNHLTTYRAGGEKGEGGVMEATHVLGGREPLSIFEGRRSRLVASRISPLGGLIRLVVPRSLA